MTIVRKVFFAHKPPFHHILTMHQSRREGELALLQLKKDADGADGGIVHAYIDGNVFGLDLYHDITRYPKSVGQEGQRHHLLLQNGVMVLTNTSISTYTLPYNKTVPSALHSPSPSRVVILIFNQLFPSPSLLFFS